MTREPLTPNQISDLERLSVTERQRARLSEAWAREVTAWKRRYAQADKAHQREVGALKMELAEAADLLSLLEYDSDGVPVGYPRPESVDSWEERYNIQHPVFDDTTARARRS